MKSSGMPSLDKVRQWTGAGPVPKTSFLPEISVTEGDSAEEEIQAFDPDVLAQKYMESR
jgi:hypothetical protein